MTRKADAKNAMKAIANTDDDVNITQECINPKCKNRFYGSFRLKYCAFCGSSLGDVILKLKHPFSPKRE